MPIVDHPSQTGFSGVDAPWGELAVQSAPTVLEMVHRRAALQPDDIAFRFLADGEARATELSYAALDQQARAIAARLQQRVAPGARALLQLPSDGSFVAAFCGCLYAGVIAVPAPVPHRNRPHEALRAIVADCAPDVVISNSGLFAERERIKASLDVGDDRWLVLDGPDGDPSPSAWQPPEIGASDLAFLQYTSGSTSLPRGVMVSHRNLMHNQAMIRDACGHSKQTVVVGWLPMFHDMGLIGNILQPLFLGVPCTLMPPATVLQKPLRWLEAISRYRATTSGGPNFIYELCVARIRPEQAAGLDLSCWNVAFDGAEPVRTETLQRFAAVFAPAGFRAIAYHPCYGLAEATLRVCGPARPGAPTVVELDAGALEEGRAVPVTPDHGKPSQSFVACGPATPFHGVEIAIVDPDRRARLPAGQVGEIWIKGPNVAAGYWQNTEATERVFRARLVDGDGPFLRTGDLGFVHDEELFVTGRLKDLIIIYGRNIYPQDVERIAEASDPALESGRGAAFAVEIDRRERLVVALEVRPAAVRLLDAGKVQAAVREAVAKHFSVGLYRIILLGPGAIPRTSSGKIRRGACRDLFTRNLWSAIGEDRAPAAILEDSNV